MIVAADADADADAEAEHAAVNSRRPRICGICGRQIRLIQCT
jgi:hypothetical protein